MLERDYTLRRFAAPKAALEKARKAIVPPKPSKGQRKPRPYSSSELDALWATAHGHNWQALVTLNPPPTARITTWPRLRDTLQSLKDTLTNWRRRAGYPACIVVTEFDAVQGEEGEIVANFHVGFLQPLTEDQQQRLCAYWQERHRLSGNRGRAFQHDARGGGPNLRRYLAKDISRRGGRQVFVKYPAPWLPERLECRLWFTVGVKRSPAREGAKMRSEAGHRRRRFDSEHGKTPQGNLTVSTGAADSEHAPAYITTDTLGVTVPDAVASQEVMKNAELRQECPVCMRRWGRSLWVGSCKCNPSFPEC